MPKNIFIDIHRIRLCPPQQLNFLAHVMPLLQRGDDLRARAPRNDDGRCVVRYDEKALGRRSKALTQHEKLGGSMESRRLRARFV